ncbi:hypothetical protein HPP92_021385 [Vanilla planifolia]|uniref:DUF7731 domain-containing protein n=1 Tax=Vanilla planifolia TaxID=51239 RepID=A0A835PX66_VANPL|nr:hypothetical protein HPP92_021761 [Vanilla planifolia]KAG0462909.1 hypothetical protein HPP92_021385 [Vanilla planifolia]
MDIITKAMACFSDENLYSTCKESYRLSMKGAVDVPPGSVEEYCVGPCLKETTLVLHCLQNALDTFRFQNGATVRDVRRALDRGCGDGHDRGDFDVVDGYYYPGVHDYGDYDEGEKIAFSVWLMLMQICLFIWI